MTPKVFVLPAVGLSVTGGITTAVVKSADVNLRESDQEGSKTTDQTPSNTTYEFVFSSALKKELTCPRGSYPEDSLDYSNSDKHMIIACKKLEKPQPNLVWGGTMANKNPKKLHCRAKETGKNLFQCTLNAGQTINVEEIKLSNWRTYYASEEALRIT
ncbi:hypothetical protein MHLP_01255 [Candidatus Mycoplasma haematolamae str. Purdue]|uniref:Uncharacterized protein n=1 Tax=Mycoplasma haematolamae (strain Purdue) TaxID=1212765 RepID=I7CEY8_MYCHA|nr:hypothetical protein [Candidatus Mycoplasma haematolamae]AFO51831.1 hypothetical protein MHLP_01255 [Candidatus Mycoplasma haematolamae str. Purdue]